MSRIERMIEPLRQLYEQNKEEQPKIETGQKILNIDERKQWFAEHISFYIIIGDIFTEEDNILLGSIEDLFSTRTSNTILVNAICRSYGSEKWIQQTLNNHSISIGNYHFCLFICSDTDNYIEEFKEWEGRSGVVDIMTNIREIMYFFSNAIKVFGMRVEGVIEGEAQPRYIETDVILDQKDVGVGYKTTFRPKHGKYARKSLRQRIRDESKNADGYSAMYRLENDKDPFAINAVTMDYNKEYEFNVDFRPPVQKYGTGQYIYDGKEVK